MKEGGEERVWTVPNVVTGLRLLAAFPLVWLAWEGERSLFAGLLLLMLLSDWLDGKLAIVLDQRTELGPRLDSVSDILMYSAVALAFLWLEPDAIHAAVGWLAAALGTWALSAVVALARFGRFPSYHTRAAKTGWLVVGGVALYTIWSGDARGVPWALGWVVLTNLEAVAVGLLLPEWRSDVSSVIDVLEGRYAGGAASPEPGEESE